MQRIEMERERAEAQAQVVDPRTHLSRVASLLDADEDETVSQALKRYAPSSTSSRYVQVPIPTLTIIRGRSAMTKGRNGKAIATTTPHVGDKKKWEALAEAADALVGIGMMSVFGESCS